MARDPDFAGALLREGIDTMLPGDVDTTTGKAILRDYIEDLLEKTAAKPSMPASSTRRPVW